MKLNNRQRMRASNKRASAYLLDNGYDEIWLKAHGKNPDTTKTQHGNYKALDLWNLFDGICFFKSTPIFLQIKTNAWAKPSPITSFQKRRNIHVMIINVTNKLASCNGNWMVFTRDYSP